MLALFGAYDMSTFLAFAAIEELKISYLKFGPTEFRVALVVINALLIRYGTGQMISGLKYVNAGAVVGLTAAPNHATQVMSGAGCASTLNGGGASAGGHDMIAARRRGHVSKVPSVSEGIGIGRSAPRSHSRVHPPSRNNPSMSAAVNAIEAGPSHGSIRQA